MQPILWNGFHFFVGVRGGGWYFWEVVVGAHSPCHLIFTLFQSNVYKVNVRLPPCGFKSWKRTTFDVMMVWHEVLTDVKWREPFNEDVFEASIQRFFIVPYKRCYDDYLLGFSKTWLQMSLCLWLECVCVYIHWFKTFFKLSWTLFISAIFKRWQDKSLLNFLFSLCWGLNRLKCDGLCLLLSYCDCYFACERSFLAGKDSPGKFAHCRLPSHI